MSRLSRRTPADGEQTRMLTKTQCTRLVMVATDRGHHHSPDTKPVGTLNHTKGWDQIQHGMWQRTLHSGSEPWLQYAHTPPFALSAVPLLRRQLLAGQLTSEPTACGHVPTSSQMSRQAPRRPLTFWVLVCSCLGSFAFSRLLPQRSSERPHPVVTGRWPGSAMPCHCQVY
jgi:hypothetical protein